MTNVGNFAVVGKVFDSYEQFFQAFDEFCKKNYQPFIITTNNSRQVTLHCRHGHKRGSESTGKRKNLHYIYLGCTAKITCYKPAKLKSVKITTVNLVHNHEISDSAYQRTEVNELEAELITDLHDGNCKTSQIARVLKNKYDKDLSTKQIRNGEKKEVIMKLLEHKSKLSIREINIGSDDGCVNGRKETCFQRHGELFPNQNIRMILVGPSNCGKTVALLNMIYASNGISFKNIYIYSKSLYQKKYQELGSIMKTLPEIGYYTYNNSESVISLDDVKPYSIMIFDDTACEPKGHMRSYFSLGRHKNVDSFYLSQTYSQIPKMLIRDNANCLLVFHQDRTNLHHIFTDHVEPDVKFEKFVEMCALAWNSRQNGCLMINKECDLDKGRYRIGFDTFIML
jgi:hypothetical protein